MSLLIGYEVKSIELWPMSGLATIDGDFEKNPKHEFIIAINGPALNVVLAILCTLVGWDQIDNKYLNFIFKINISLALFNLIPIGFLDGGRILHATYIYFFEDEERVDKLTLYSTMIIGAVVVPLIWVFWLPFAACILLFMMSVCLMQYSAKKLVKARKKRDDLLQEEIDNLLILKREINEILDAQFEYLRSDNPSGSIKLVQLERRTGAAEILIHTAYADNDFTKMIEARSKLLDVLTSMKELVKSIPGLGG